MKDIMKVVKSLEKFGSLIKGVIKIIKNEAKGQDGGLHGMLLGTSGSSLFRNVLAGRGEKRASEGIIRTGQDFYCLYIL